MNQTTLDQLELEATIKRQRQAKVDARTKDKVEVLDDKKADTTTKEALALANTEKSLHYWTSMIESQQDILQKEKEKIEQTYERKLDNLKRIYDVDVKQLEDKLENLKRKYDADVQNLEEKRDQKIKDQFVEYQKGIVYYTNQIANTEAKKAIVQQAFETQRTRHEKKKTKLANTIQTPKIKLETVELLENEESDSTQETVTPPPQPKVQPKAVKPTVVKPSPELGNFQPESDPVLIKAARDREIVSELEKELQRNNAEDVRTLSLLKAERSKIKPDEDKIDEYERKRDFLKDERANLIARLPKGFRTSIG